MNKEQAWIKLFAFYPSLRKPFDASLRSQWEETMLLLFKKAVDENELHQISKPFVLEMLETKYISIHYYWRIAEAFMDTIETQPQITNFTKKSVRLVVERVFKVMQNTFADQPWSCEDATDPHHMDLTGHRAVVEAGYW